MKKQQRRGFTIVELVIVIAVIAILAAVLIPTFSNMISKANDSKALQEARNAYTTYMINAAESGATARYFVYQADDTRFVAIDSGSALGVYETAEAALKSMLPDADAADLILIGDLLVYGGEAGNGNNGENVKESLSGKKISFMGDSITTYLNWNNNTAFNSTLGGNAVFYERSDKKGLLNSVNYTWWMRTVENLGLELCVNNSWSGSYVTKNGAENKYGCGTRTQNLHNDKKNESPDIIVVYMGTNDANNAVKINTFTSDYNTMVSKIKTNYPNADIYLCTIDNYKFQSNRNPVAYNDVIKSIAAEQGCTVVDFYSGTSISPETIVTYTVDSYLHPNAKGMAEMYECVKNALAENYKITEAGDEPIFSRDVIEALKVSSLVKSSTGPYMYLGSVNEKLSGKTVTRIGVPIISVADYAKESSFTVYVVDSTAPYTKHTTYEITIPASRFSDNTVNQWVYFDVNIKLEEGQSLAYECNDTVAIGYKKGSLIQGNEAGFINIKNGNPTTNSSILLDISVKED